MVSYFKFRCPFVHCWHAETQLSFVCLSCLVWPCWTHLLVLGSFSGLWWYFVDSFGFFYSVSHHAVCTQDSFILSFLMCTFHLVFLPYRMLRPPAPCWSRAVRTDLLASFPVIGAEHSVVHPWARCSLWVFTDGLPWAPLYSCFYETFCHEF